MCWIMNHMIVNIVIAKSFSVPNSYYLVIDLNGIVFNYERLERII